MVEILLKEMKFQNDASINYDPHHIISIKRQVNKNNPFEQHEIAGLVESANWIDYPHETQRDDDMQQDSISLMKDSSSKQPNP